MSTLLWTYTSYYCHAHTSSHRFVKAPRVHWDFTTSRVLTMEFIDGGKVNNTEYLEKHRLRGEDVSGCGVGGATVEI